MRKPASPQTAEDEESLVSVVDSHLAMQHHKSYAELCNSIAGGTTATHQGVEEVVEWEVKWSNKIEE